MSNSQTPGGPTQAEDKEDGLLPDSETQSSQRARSARAIFVPIMLLIAAALTWDYYSYSTQADTQSALQQVIATGTARYLALGQAQATATAASGDLFALHIQATQTSGERSLTRARMILAQAESAGARDPVLGTLLALESISTTLYAGQQPLPEAESFLHAALTRPWPIVTFKASGAHAKVVISPDGRDNLLVAGGTDQADIRNANNGAVWRTLHSPGAGLMDAAWSPDGRSVAGFGRAGRVVIWDVETGQPITSSQSSPTLSPGVAYSPNGEKLAITSGEGDNIPAILNVADLPGARVSLRGHTGRVNSVAWSVDGARVLTVSDDGTARIWDSSTGALIFTVQAAGAASASGSLKVTRAAFSPDGNAILVVQSDGSVIVVNAAGGSIENTLPGRGADTGNGARSNFAYAAWGADAHTLLTAGEDGRGRVWSLSPTGEETLLVGSGAPLTYVSLSSDGLEVATTALDGTVQIWDLNPASYTELPAIRPFGLDVQPWESTSHFHGAVYSPDGLLLATTGEDGLLRVWDAHTGEQMLALKSGTDEFSGTPAWSPDGRSVAVGGHEGSNGSLNQVGVVSVWDVPSGARRLYLRGLPNDVISVAWSPDGQRIVAGSADGPVKMWDAVTGADFALLDGHTKWVSSIVYSPAGDKLATSSWDGSVRVWDASGKQLTSMLGHADIIRDVVWSPDATKLASVSDDNTARIWDASTGGQLLVIRGGGGNVTSALAWSPDGTRLAVAQDDDTVHVWSLTMNTGGSMTSKDVLTLQEGIGPVKQNRILQVRYAPDGQSIVSGNEGGLVGIWSAITGESAGSYRHRDRVAGIDYSPDGCTLASAGWDGQVLQVPLCMKELTSMAQQYAGRPLSTQERALYLNSLP